jgi:hypothetical protein
MDPLYKIFKLSQLNGKSGWNPENLKRITILQFIFNVVMVDQDTGMAA